MYLANEDSGEERRRKKWKEGKNEEARGKERKENKDMQSTIFLCGEEKASGKYLKKI